jgi:hypothetical protein
MTTTAGEGGCCPSPGRRGPGRTGRGSRGGGTAVRSLNGENYCNEKGDDNDNINNESPTMALTFQKLRSVLHHAIADQASSLRDALGHQRGDRATAPMMTAAAMAEWEMFAIDLHLSATSRRLLLMLSHLLGWIDLLEGYLSFVLSRHLSGGDAATPPPPGPAPASTSSTVAAIMIVLIHDSRKDAYQPTHNVLLACLLRPVRVPRRRRCRDPLTPRAGTGMDIVDGRYNRDYPHPPPS